MTGRERMMRTLNFQDVDRIPRDLWTLPGIGMFRQDEADRLLNRFPMDLVRADIGYGDGKREQGIPNRVGSSVDAWGTTWVVAEDGVVGEVKTPLLADWSGLDRYTLPWELLEGIDFSGISRQRETDDRFILAGTQVRPFERMQFLRGTENVMMDLAYGSMELERLREMLDEFNLKELDLVAGSDVDGVMFMDDWGSQNALLISPAMWRNFYKPLYKKYCDLLHAKGKYVFFHSDGNIQAIYPDLIEIGVNAVNSQLFCMDLEGLGAAFAGKIVFWGELDRQHVLPFGTVVEVKAAVRRVAGALLGKKRTGVIAQMEWGTADPYTNLEAAYGEWEKA